MISPPADPCTAGRSWWQPSNAHSAHEAGHLDVVAAHTVDVAIARGLAVLTADPDPLRAIDPDVEIEELPAP
ncbi:MAG: hypothetical protein M3Y48_23165 [Actinomycetota bacterium]|nr:hypothetical protein [Actinomycetota bacterium]